MADIAAIVPRKRLIRKLHLDADSRLLSRNGNCQTARLFFNRPTVEGLPD
jgi:hypothetical protein